MDHKPRVLFFSTGDSSRSQMAEGFLREFAGDDVIPVSTAVRSPDRSPLAVEVMKEVGVDISHQQAEDVRQTLKEHFSYVISLCDSRKERFPIWPFTRNLLRWSLIDPETASGSADQQREIGSQCNVLRPFRHGARASPSVRGRWPLCYACPRK